MKIEENIPIPKNIHGEKIVLLKHMKIGDSIFVPTCMEANTIRNTLRRLKYKGLSRKVENGYRVWRIK